MSRSSFSQPKPPFAQDFLTDSYDRGPGAVSVLALSGLFKLISEYGLEYPGFYNKLYALLEPSVFHARHRARFFRLLDLFLKSTHLPAYLLAAFCKRLARLALTAPPGGAMFALALCYNLAKKHESCFSLIHRSDEAAAAAAAAAEAADEEDGSTGPLDGNNWEDSDPFVMWEEDPSEVGSSFSPPPPPPPPPRASVHPDSQQHAHTQSCALDSSLWEVQTLRAHYSPSVATLARAFSAKQLTHKRSPPMQMSDFYGVGYADLFQNAIKPRGSAKRRAQGAAVSHANLGALFVASEESKEAERLSKVAKAMGVAGGGSASSSSGVAAATVAALAAEKAAAKAGKTASLYVEDNILGEESAVDIYS